jgi:hypothetical protein
VLVPPSPKSQSNDVGVPEVDRENCTVRGAVPAVGVPLKDISGKVGKGVGVAVIATVASVTVEGFTSI